MKLLSEHATLGYDLYDTEVPSLILGHGFKDILCLSFHQGNINQGINQHCNETVAYEYRTKVSDFSVLFNRDCDFFINATNGLQDQQLYVTLVWNHAPQAAINKVNIIEPAKTVSFYADDTERKNLAIKRFTTKEEGNVSMSAACEKAANSYASSQCKEKNISDFFDGALMHVTVAPLEGNHTSVVAGSWWKIGNRFKISRKIIRDYRYYDFKASEYTRPKPVVEAERYDDYEYTTGDTISIDGPVDEDYRYYDCVAPEKDAICKVFSCDEIFNTSDTIDGPANREDDVAKITELVNSSSIGQIVGGSQEYKAPYTKEIDRVPSMRHCSTTSISLCINDTLVFKSQQTASESCPQLELSPIISKLIEQGLSIEKFKVEPYLECAVCLCDKPTKTLLICGHTVMCELCCVTWLQDNNTCPICRADVTASVDYSSLNK